MKSKSSYSRLKMPFSNIAFEDHIEDIEDIQDKIVFNSYNLAVIDEKFLWREEAEYIFKQKDIPIIYFQGDFEEIEEQIKQFFPEDESIDDSSIEEAVEEEKIKEDEQKEIRYIEKEKIVEKEVKVKVPVYKSLYTGVSNQLIGILSLSKGAGASFLTLNLGKAIAECNVMVAIIEPPIDKPYIFDTIGLEQRLNITEEEESKHFYSYPHIIKQNLKLERDRETFEDDIIWLIPDPRRELINEWDYIKMMKLLYASRKANISLIDLGNNYNNKSVKDILGELDKLIVVIDPHPTEVMQNEHILEELKGLKSEGVPIEFLVNKWTAGVEKKSLLGFIDVDIDIFVPYIEPEYVHRAVYTSKIPYVLAEAKESLEVPLARLIKKIVPSEILKDKEIKDNSNKERRFLKLFKKRKD